ncbi:AbiH family protein [Acinetobacter brisouii]|uniref:AbiH family protein n=1 Tax=Acinetobacter brisouii TaxID=396323 RepID=UPI0005F7E17D|nr:AbiH family protein [Acinetobacter brisouii]KJV41194.1 hypothetical protein VH98_00745 [Acinetobacter brisouii]
MNILIVGNGFDLSHYLPTKYDHFMDVMQSIEEKDLLKHAKDVFNNPIDDLPALIRKGFEVKQAVDEKSYQMNFNQLFLNTRDKGFITKTREFYNTDDIKINFEKIVKIQEKLKDNCWYQYFSAHVKDIQTWIDFESKINEALKVVANFVVKLESKSDEYGCFDTKICFLGKGDNGQIFLTRAHCNLLQELGVLVSGYYQDYTDFDENGDECVGLDEVDHEVGDFRFYINQKYILNYSGSINFNHGALFNLLQLKLDEFIGLFNFYLEEVVRKLKPKKAFQPLKSIDYDQTQIDQIYSFNYTQTYLDFYNQDTKIDFLHGKSGEDQNMVLGISELKDDVLKKIKAYGFTKYHQKLMKNTNYGFLNHNEEFDNLVNPSGMREGEIIQINIWGHSLDVSDEDYIQEIFSFNGNEDQYVRVTVFYFDTSAKFSLLANLLHILGKEKVEHWMKQGWLKFEPNSDIAQLNQIQPVELPKSTQIKKDDI